ncbi:MAG: nucleotidyltransferase family protein, partial [Acidobacteriota bacterium]
MAPDLKFGPEWAVLELLCVGLDAPDRRARFEELVTSGELHWGELLEQAIRNKMEAMLAYHLLPAHLVGAVPDRLFKHLCGVYDANLYRRKPWYETVHRVVAALEAKDIPVAGRKQVTFEGSLYAGNGSRRLGDIDLLILPRDMEAVAEILGDLGFQAAYYDWTTEELVPIPRRDMMIYRL